MTPAARILLAAIRAADPEDVAEVRAALARGGAGGAGSGGEPAPRATMEER